MEALGAMAHFKQEKITDRPIPRPKVEDAVKTIVDYMNGPTARPVPQLDYSKSKKVRGVKKPKMQKGVKKPKAPAKKSA
jgi:intracellular multiplication protein IcmP